MKQYIILFFTSIFLFPLMVQGQEKLMKKGDKAVGDASYYHSKFNGKKTASGEVYYASKMTCAHLTLPFGTILKVTNLRNRKVVQVKVNDRGPYSKKRIVDLSFGAASKLDMIRDGVVAVEIEVLSLPEGNTLTVKEEKKKTKNDKALKKTKAAKAKKKKTTTKTTTTVKKSAAFSAGKTYNVWGTEQNVTGYGVQLASYTDLEEAITIGKEAIDLGLKPVFIQCGWANSKRIYRLMCGNYKTAAEAREYIRKTKSKGFKGTFVKKHL
ncbi:MAG: septal ring lytic transglycosylase RlpA family protein [Flammeovirgaceae bacterium]